MHSGHLTAVLCALHTPDLCSAHGVCYTLLTPSLCALLTPDPCALYIMHSWTLLPEFCVTHYCPLYRFLSHAPFVLHTCDHCTLCIIPLIPALLISVSYVLLSPAVYTRYALIIHKHYNNNNTFTIYILLSSVFCALCMSKPCALCSTHSQPLRSLRYALLAPVLCALHTPEPFALYNTECALSCTFHTRTVTSLL